MSYLQGCPYTWHDSLTRKELTQPLQAVPAEAPSGRELEKYDRKFLPKPAGVPQKQRQMLLGLSQLFHVRDETICFDRSVSPTGEDNRLSGAVSSGDIVVDG